MCLRNFSKTGSAKLRSIAKKIYHEMLADLQCLACHSLDKESWIVLKDLFVRKWREEKKFPNPEVADAAASAVSYLENNWFAEDQPCMWFQGTVPLSPVTNNSLERQNGILKSAGYSGRQKLGLEELFNMVRFRRYHLTFSPLILFLFLSLVTTLLNRHPRTSTTCQGRRSQESRSVKLKNSRKLGLTHQ